MPFTVKEKPALTQKTESLEAITHSFFSVLIVKRVKA